MVNDCDEIIYKNYNKYSVTWDASSGDSYTAISMIDSTSSSIYKEMYDLTVKTISGYWSVGDEYWKDGTTSGNWRTTNNYYVRTTTLSDTWESWSSGRGGRAHTPKTAQQRLQDIIQNRLAPAIHTHRKAVRLPQDPREQRAHETLQLVIGPQRYRQFLKNGYVTIHSPINGKTYQVYPGTHFTRVHYKGKRESDLCIYLAHDFPPTDQLIAKILLIQTDPNHYHRTANTFAANQRIISAPAPEQQLSLPEIYADLKKQVA